MQYYLSMPRYTIDFDDDFDQTLTELVKTSDATTKADVIRRAVATYSYLEEGSKKRNKTLKVAITEDDKVTKEIVLPLARCNSQQTVSSG
jgi:Arc/MetJ-type ribon-helix-helix transcriptional regulator